MDNNKNDNFNKIDIQSKNVPAELTVALSKEKVEVEIKKGRIIRTLYIIGGTISLGLAILGIIVPGLPTTPFALLSAFLYAKSSERLYNWLLNNKILGPRIKNYHKRKGVTKKGKVGVIIFMTIMVLFSSFIVISNVTVRIVILSLGLIGAITVWYFVPTAND